MDEPADGWDGTDAPRRHTSLVGVALRTPADVYDRFLHQLGGTPADRVALHVGFGHAATTSLQENFFAARDDVYYSGAAGPAGRFLALLKYRDDARLDVAELARECRGAVYLAPQRSGRPVVLSDETLTDCAEVFYAPRLLPPDAVAVRLKRFFPHARIVFTVRSQYDYVASMYHNLKRNYAYLAGMPIPPFDEWWAGQQTQDACWYLTNLDYQPVVQVYADLFGAANVLVLPLEELKATGAAVYLGRLCQFLGVPLRPEDVARFGTPRNARMSVVEERVAELIAGRLAEPLVRRALENDALAGLIRDASPAHLHLSDEVREAIRARTAAGNRRLARQFRLPLQESGYPW